MLERGLSAWLVSEVEALGGVSIRLMPQAGKGIPDWLVVMPGPKYVFIELKRPDGKGKASKVQRWLRRQLLQLGAKSIISDSKADISAILRS